MSGILRRYSHLILVLLAIMPAHMAHAADVERVPALIRGGALRLALNLVEQGQPAPEQADVWMLWERQRIAVYQVQRDWDAVARRAEAIPPGLGDSDRRWLQTEAARARLRAADGEGARRFLRRLIWEQRADSDPAEQAALRQLVIRSYLVDNNLADAQIAVLRYMQDFSVRNDSWQELHATILLRSGKPGAAHEALAGVLTYEGRLLSLLAALRERIYPAATLLQQAQKLARETRNLPELNHRAWVLLAMAAVQKNDAVQRVNGLEHALTADAEIAAGDGLFTATADELWQAYDALAETIGNSAHLLVGNDAAWLAKAAAYKRDDAMQVRALYAFLSSHAGKPENRELAHQRLVDSLREDGRMRVARSLYTESVRHASIDQVPAAVRYRLMDYALENYDIRFAAAVLQGLPAPQGDAAGDWQLRRARILIYAGDYDGALTGLRALLGQITVFDDDFTERYVQVIFDLQMAGRHRDAISLLESVYHLTGNPRMQREMLYWMAESCVALGEFTLAAELYLQSAAFLDPRGGDMWGQSARFHAAEALGKAGLTADARSVYSGLLKFTEDPKRRLLLERNIQQLWLLEKKPATP